MTGTDPTQPPKPDLDDAELAAAWEAEGREIRGMVGELNALIAVAGLIPLGLITLMATALFGDGAWVLMPIGFAALATSPWWLAVWRRYQSPLPLVLRDGTRFTGNAKRRVIRAAGFGLPGLLLIGWWGESRINHGVRLIGEALMQWRIPWSTLGF